MLGETILLMKVTFDSRLPHEDRNEISWSAKWRSMYPDIGICIGLWGITQMWRGLIVHIFFLSVRIGPEKSRSVFFKSLLPFLTESRKMNFSIEKKKLEKETLMILSIRHLFIYTEIHDQKQYLLKNQLNRRSVLFRSIWQRLVLIRRENRKSKT